MKTDYYLRGGKKNYIRSGDLLVHDQVIINRHVPEYTQSVDRDVFLISTWTTVVFASIFLMSDEGFSIFPLYIYIYISTLFFSPPSDRPLLYYTRPVSVQVFPTRKLFYFVSSAKWIDSLSSKHAAVQHINLNTYILSIKRFIFHPTMILFTSIPVDRLKYI